MVINWLQKKRSGYKKNDLVISGYKKSDLVIKNENGYFLVISGLGGYGYFPLS